MEEVKKMASFITIIYIKEGEKRDFISRGHSFDMSIFHDNKRKHVTPTDKRMYMYTYKLTIEHIKHMSIIVS